MKNLSPLFIFIVLAWVGIQLCGCSSDDSEIPINDFTGNETIYPLSQGSEFPISGTATFKEMTNGNTMLLVELTGTEGTEMHPVHFHEGDITEDGAIIFMPNPVSAATGISETEISIMPDGTKITYEELNNLNANIRVHLEESGPGAMVVLAGGNIGAAYQNNPSGSGRLAIPICTDWTIN